MTTTTPPHRPHHVRCCVAGATSPPFPSPSLVPSRWCVISGGDIARHISLAVYGVCLVLLFAVSATYHRGPWSLKTRRVWGRLDHATIFLAIAGTYTPVVVNVLQGWQSIVLLTVDLGARRRRCHRRHHRHSAAAMGGGGALHRGRDGRSCSSCRRSATASTEAGSSCSRVGGALYSAGAIVYALRWPRLWPRVFGFHEVFHVLVIAATAVYFVFIAATIAAPR